ncbi:MAG: hypothetical protein EA381_04485, partial [Planctomycetaceae bacterium]
MNFRLWFWLCLGLFGFCLPLPGASAQGKKYALLVGVQKYDASQLSPLAYAERDAEALGEVLKGLEFDVKVMTSSAPIPSLEPVLAEDIFRQLDRRLATLTRDDTILIFLSGHGVQLKSDPPDQDGGKETYFCPQRADLGNRDSLVPISEVMRRLAASGAGKKLLLVDACRDEVEPKDVRNKSVEKELDPVGSIRRRVPGGMMALFSCSAKEQSFELESLGHSAFSYHLLKYLRGEADTFRYPRQELSLTEMVSYVTRETRDFIDGRLDKDQTPQMVGKANEWSLGRLLVLGVTEGTRAGEVRTFAGDSQVKFCWCPPGSFRMGSPPNEPGRYDDETQVDVRLSRGFWLGQTEVTQGFWQAVMGTRPWSGESNVREGINYPATYVSWEDAVAFCDRLTSRERAAGRLPAGWSYRLPTEAEWEYACRAGTSTAYSFGNVEARLGEFAWYSANAGGHTHEVGTKAANPWGLYDCHGNVWEWVQDWFDRELAGGLDPTGPTTGSNRVYRGGGWFNSARDVRSASRIYGDPSRRGNGLGF